VQHALTFEIIERVTIFTYGTLAPPDHFQFIDRLLNFTNPTPHIQIDVGYHMQLAVPNHIALVTVEPNHPNQPQNLTIYPLLHGSLQNRDNYGTVFCKKPVTGEAIKIYPGVTHLLKTQSKNFLTIPK